MNKELELEANTYVGNKYLAQESEAIEDFIAGATSKYIEKQKLEFAIKENKSILQMLVLHGNARTRLPVTERIKELEKKLSEL